jgi:hypothetical protein
MTEDNAWTEDVTKVVADRAYSLNYEEGMTCGFRPIPSADGSRTIEVLLEMTHSGQAFDLTWLVKFTDSSDTGIHFELFAPPVGGGNLWTEHRGTVAELMEDAQALPVFIRGYFIGRNSVAAGEIAEASTPPD